MMPWWMQFDRFLREGEGVGAGGSQEPVEPASEEDVPPASEEPAPIEPLTREAITLPDGVEVDDDVMNEFVELINSDMTPQERANALIGLQIKTQEAAGNALAEAWSQTQQEWRETVTKEFGDKLEPALGQIRELVDEYGSPELLEVFDFTGAGNHPQMIKFLANIAEVLVKEAEPVSGAPTSTPTDRAHKMFPNMQ